MAVPGLPGLNRATQPLPDLSRIDIHGLPPAQQRAILRRWGYDVDEGGGRTLRLRTAISNFVATKGAGADNWNTNGPVRGGLKLQGGAIVRTVLPKQAHKYGDTVPVDVPHASNGAVPPEHAGPGGNKNGPGRAKTKNNTTHGSQVDPSGSAASGSDLTGIGALLAAQVGGLAKIAGRTPSYVKLGRIPVAPTRDPLKGATADAELQYGTPLAQLGRDIGRQDAQGDQNLADIGSWYGQVRGSLDKAKAANAAAADLAANEAQGAGSDILASLGGGANEAAGAIGQATANNANLIRALGLVQSNADQSAGGALSMESASQRLRQSRLDAQAAADLRNKRVDLQGERGAFMAADQDKIRQENFTNLLQGFDTEMGARKFNTDLRQQQFGNLTTIPSLTIAAATAEPQLQAAYADAANKAAGGLTPYERSQQRYRIAKDVRDRRAKTSDEIAGALKASHTEQGGDGTKRTVTDVKGRVKAVSTAIAIARKNNLDLRKPEVQQIIEDAVRLNVGGYDPRAYDPLFKQAWGKK